MDGLIDIQHVDLIVPRPWIQCGTVIIGIDQAWSALTHSSKQGRFSRAAREVDCCRSSLGIFSCFEEPVEGTYIEALPDECRGQIDIPGIGSCARGSLADVSLVGYCQSLLDMGTNTQRTSLKESDVPYPSLTGIVVTPVGFGGNWANAKEMHKGTRATGLVGHITSDGVLNLGNKSQAKEEVQISKQAMNEK